MIVSHSRRTVATIPNKGNIHPYKGTKSPVATARIKKIKSIADSESFLCGCSTALLLMKSVAANAIRKVSMRIIPLTEIKCTFTMPEKTSINEDEKMATVKRCAQRTSRESYR
jgi:hypothetical protein